MGDLLRDTIAGAIRTSFEAVDQLAYEMEEQYENAVDWAQVSDANQSRIAAAAVLGSVREPSIPSSVRNESQLIEFWRKTERTRPDRLQNAINCLDVCVFHISKLPGEPAHNLALELTRIIEVIKNTYFPPMFQNGGHKRRKR
jgi:hypothetical protein